MKILFTGKGTSGSWQIRGVQMAQAMGAVAAPMATLEQCAAADVIVAVKRIPDQLLATIRKSGKPWAWDCVDAYPQPACSGWGREQAMLWLRAEVARLKPDLVIWPNQRIQEDAGHGEVVYHHHRPGIEINPIRERIEVIGYEGSEKFIDSWRPAIEAECRRIGARFVVNPPRLADVDVVLALRGDGWNGYPQARWKSNVKIANAHGSGTPFIGAPEDGYTETACGAEYWATSAEQLRMSLDWLAPRETRAEVKSRFLRAAMPIEKAAKRYEEVLCALRS